MMPPNMLWLGCCMRFDPVVWAGIALHVAAIYTQSFIAKAVMVGFHKIVRRKKSLSISRLHRVTQNDFIIFCFKPTLTVVFEWMPGLNRNQLNLDAEGNVLLYLVEYCCVKNDAHL